MKGCNRSARATDANRSADGKVLVGIKNGGDTIIRIKLQVVYLGSYSDGTRATGGVILEGDSGIGIARFKKGKIVDSCGAISNMKGDFG